MHENRKRNPFRPSFIQLHKSHQIRRQRSLSPFPPHSKFKIIFLNLNFVFPANFNKLFQPSPWVNKIFILSFAATVAAVAIVAVIVVVAVWHNA